MSDLKQGGLANSSGNTLESTIKATLVSKGFEIVSYRDYVKNPSSYGKELLLLGVPYTTIYGHKGKTEFLLKSEHYALEIRIECKWQQSFGSVDEKFPYLYLNCIEKMPEDKIFIVMDGGGAKLGSIDWLKQSSLKKLYTTELNKNKEILVMTLSEFLVWTNKTLR
jgi:hypothetical protein